MMKLQDQPDQLTSKLESRSVFLEPAYHNGLSLWRFFGTGHAFVCNYLWKTSFNQHKTRLPPCADYCNDFVCSRNIWKNGPVSRTCKGFERMDDMNLLNRTKPPLTLSLRLFSLSHRYMAQNKLIITVGHAYTCAHLTALTPKHTQTLTPTPQRSTNHKTSSQDQHQPRWPQNIRNISELAQVRWVLGERTYTDM